ncbi:MAG TPA: lysophospholipid acyltransferase family protein [Solimonas sp.]|nr:lysophospholipid acyltransferase family protein [Solimonas sp.]
MIDSAAARAAPIGRWAWLDRRWRQFATGFCFFVFGMGGILFGLLVFPVACLPAPDRATAKRRAQSLVQRWFRFFAGLMRTVGVITWEIHGEEKLRKPGQMIIANHPTLIDVVLLIAYIPEVDCIVKQALFRNPFTRLPITWAGYISNSTPEQLVADCSDALKAGRSLMIFPEGTRSRPGEPIRIPHGTARIALESGAPILPVTIACSPLMLNKHVPFWRVPPRPGHWTITVGEAYSPAPFLAAAPSMAIAARRLSRHWEHEFSLRTGRVPAREEAAA